LEGTLITANIIEQIDNQIAKLQAARALLTSPVTQNGPGRPKKSANAFAPVKAKSTKRVLSPEAKDRIAAAQKKRWAKAGRASKKAAKAEATV
jgi:hypothetical protein